MLHHLVLPALVLGTVPLAGRMRQMRANLLDVLRLDYVTTARAKGLDENVVIWKHAVRNAINPLITLFGYTLGDAALGLVRRRDRLRAGRASAASRSRPCSSRTSTWSWARS